MFGYRGSVFSLAVDHLKEQEGGHGVRCLRPGRDKPNPRAAIRFREFVANLFLEPRHGRRARSGEQEMSPPLLWFLRFPGLMSARIRRYPKQSPTLKFGCVSNRKSYTKLRIKEQIRYEFSETDRGARIRLVTSSPETTDALHTFLLLH